MKNLLELIKTRTNELSNDSKSKFNTNDHLIDILLNKKIERSDVIDILISKRLEFMNLDLDKMDKDELNNLIDKLYKTSKNGLDTSVSDSNNNSSFSYNDRYNDYKLIKSGSILSIVKIDEK